MIDRQHIPVIVFATCVVMALVLAVLTGGWTTALAIALSGCALALAMRPPEHENHDAAFLEEDIADLRKSIDSRDADIAALRGSINEMAEIIESIAGDMQGIAAGSSPREMEQLRAVVAALGEQVETFDGSAARNMVRLKALEQKISGLEHARPTMAEPMHAAKPMRAVEPVALAVQGVASVATEKKRGGGASIMERAESLRKRATPPPKSGQVSLMPLFDIDQSPLSLLIDHAGDVGSAQGSVAAVDHALALVKASEETDSRIFVRLPQDVSMHPDTADLLVPVIEKYAGVLPRLVVMLPQAAVKSGLPRALEQLLEAGARFALERVTDWSVDLNGLAARGLAVIAVDGPAMAQSAIAQKGDPTRLRQVLHERDVQLLAWDIETRAQLDTVLSLQPDLIAGAGLGETTVMDLFE